MLYKNARFFMRYKIGLLILIISASLMFCFTANSLAESTIVAGNKDKLIVLTYTKYLDGKPVLIFSERALEESSNLLDKVDNIVFCDSAWQDLAGKLVDGKAKEEVWQKINSPENETAYILTKDGEFYVPETIKNYELKIKLKPKAVKSRVYISPKILSDITFRTTPVLFKIDVDIDLEEFPVFKLEGEFKNRTSSKLFIYLGIDYTGDNIIDGCLKFEDVNVCVYNIFQLAKNKWQKFNKFVLKEIHFLILPEDKKENEKEKVEAGIFSIKDISLYNENSFIIESDDIYEKFPYPLKTEHGKKRFLSLLSIVNFPLVKIDNQVFSLNDFERGKTLEDLEKGVLLKKIALKRGNHKYEKLKNEIFDVEWVIIEPEGRGQRTEGRNEPEITFKKINPAKYLVKVKGAKNPFWLVFSESFHEQWRLYRGQRTEGRGQKFEEIVADYPELGVKEAKHLVKFTPQDIKFLFEKPLEASHQLVNTYANGWYIEPRKLGLGEDFILVMYFWPQSLFYLGLGISGATFIVCTVYLIFSGLRKRKGRKG